MAMFIRLSVCLSVHLFTRLAAATNGVTNVPPS